MGSFEKWIKGLIAAAISGFSNSISVMVVDPNDFNLESGLAKVTKVAVVSAIISGALYLKMNPVWPSEGDKAIAEASKQAEAAGVSKEQIKDIKTQSAESVVAQISVLNPPDTGAAPLSSLKNDGGNR